jgi:hypothetical protein
VSGGHYDYKYSKVIEFMEQLESDMDSKVVDESELRRKFGKHLYNVAMAMRAIEWNDSGDGDDREEALIKLCIQGVKP